mgnify:CR=1 FL=1
MTAARPDARGRRSPAGDLAAARPRPAPSPSPSSTPAPSAPRSTTTSRRDRPRDREPLPPRGPGPRDFQLTPGAGREASGLGWLAPVRCRASGGPVRSSASSSGVGAGDARHRRAPDRARCPCDQLAGSSAAAPPAGRAAAGGSRRNAAPRRNQRRSRRDAPRAARDVRGGSRRRDRRASRLAAAATGSPRLRPRPIGRRQAAASATTDGVGPAAPAPTSVGISRRPSTGRHERRPASVPTPCSDGSIGLGRRSPLLIVSAIVLGSCCRPRSRSAEAATPADPAGRHDAAREPGSNSIRSGPVPGTLRSCPPNA